jgi:hypothetical protein
MNTNRCFGIAMALLFTACAVSEANEENATTQQSETQSGGAAADEAIESVAPNWRGCPVGDPSNFCVNRERTFCPTEGVRSQCYIPEYCEWGRLQCQGGIWVMI